MKNFKFDAPVFEEDESTQAVQVLAEALNTNYRATIKLLNNYTEKSGSTMLDPNMIDSILYDYGWIRINTYNHTIESIIKKNNNCKLLLFNKNMSLSIIDKGEPVGIEPTGSERPVAVWVKGISAKPNISYIDIYNIIFGKAKFIYKIIDKFIKRKNNSIRIEYYNPNPISAKEDKADCTIRALSKATNMSWEESFNLLRTLSEKRNYPIGTVRLLVIALQTKFGFNIDNNIKTNRPLKEVVKDLNKGTYVVFLQGHVLTVIDGVIYDDDHYNGLLLEGKVLLVLKQNIDISKIVSIASGLGGLF